ncbi:MAG: thermonuclease family protein [Halioglobus sp.]
MSRARKNSGPGRYRKFRVLLLALVGLSVVQYLKQGEVSWPVDVYQHVSSTVLDYTSRPEAGWRKASETLNDLVPAEGNPGTFDFTGTVVRVFDGDTVSVLDSSGSQHRVRLHGIDTPEYDQPHGRQASRALQQLLADRKVGIVVKDIDRLDRTVAVVYLDGVNINLSMVSTGDAWWYRHYASSDRALRLAERGAQDKRLGLWGAKDPVPPWEWRRGRR